MLSATASVVMVLHTAIGETAAPDNPDAIAKETEIAAAEESTTYDRIWRFGTLYKNEDNPVIQKFVMTGRVQADAAFFDGGQGDYDRLDWRRFRFGFKSSLFQDFVLHFEGDFNLNNLDPDQNEDVYVRFTDFNLSWSQGDAFMLKIGKQSSPFTLAGATSSKKLLTLERSTVATNLWFPTEYFTGVAALGKIANWNYYTGIFSSSGDDEFGSFDSGYFGLVSLEYNFADSTGLDTSLVRIDYVYNDPDFSGNVGTRELKQVASLTTKFENGRYGIWSDISFGDGIENQSDLIGFLVMPYYEIMDKLQLVFRYSLVTSSADNGVRLNRYESRIESGRSDEAHEYFLGLNWYLYGHKLKWQNGVEYTHTSDSARDDGAYDGWGFTSGIRLSW